MYNVIKGHLSELKDSTFLTSVSITYLYTDIKLKKLQRKLALPLHLYLHPISIILCHALTKYTYVMC